MDLSLQLLEGKFSENMLRHFDADVFSEKRKLKKAAKICRKILIGEIITEDIIDKNLKFIRRLAVENTTQPLQLAEVVFLIGKEDYSGVLNGLDYFTEELDMIDYAHEVEYLGAFIRTYEQEKTEAVKEDMKIILNYLSGDTDLGIPLWKLAYDYEDYATLEALQSYAKCLQPDDFSVLEFHCWLLQKKEEHNEVVSMLVTYLKEKPEAANEPSVKVQVYITLCQSLIKLEQYKRVTEEVATALEALTENYDAVIQKSELLLLRQEAINNLSKQDDFIAADWSNIIEEDLAFLKQLHAEDERFTKIQQNTPII